MKKIYIKNMVCDRCITSVKEVFINNGFVPKKVKLGEVHVENLPSEDETLIIKEKLKHKGFDWIESDSPILVTKIKAALIDLFNKGEIPEDFKLSTYLSEKFPYDYSHISRVFSSNENDTIEHYLIMLRIEKAKEFLSYKDQNVSEVAYRLGYASVAHFSRQFKAKVGISPRVYQNNPINRKSLEDL